MWAQALSSESFIAAQPLLPPALSVADAGELLQQLQRSKRLPAALLLGDVAISQAFLEATAKALGKEVQEAAEQAMKGKKREEPKEAKKKKGKSQKKRGACHLDT